MFRCKEAGFANKLIGFEKILLGVKEYGNHSNPYDWRAESEKYLPFFLLLEVYDLVFSQQGIYNKNLRQVLGSAYHIEHAKTLT